MCYTLSSVAEEFHEELEDKPVTIAIHEVADDELTGYVKDEYKN